MVFMDEAGRLREHTKLDNLVDPDTRDEFVDMVRRRKPDVVVIGGFSMATAKLAQRIKDILHFKDDSAAPQQPHGADEEFDKIPVIYVFDDVARMYQHSKRAADEFSALSPIAKYCVGLARYTQSPLNEYASLGADITSISFDEDNQQLASNQFR